MTTVEYRPSNHVAKPCPSCRGVARLRKKPGANQYRVKCQHCGRWEPYYTTREEAVLAWNALYRTPIRDLRP